MATSTDGASPNRTNHVGKRRVESPIEAAPRATIWMSGLWGVITAFTGVRDLQEPLAKLDRALKREPKSVDETVERVLALVPESGYDA